ncbi:right-handed parallel beta-helix repeat-containing protein [Bacteroidota bacterium]
MDTPRYFQKEIYTLLKPVITLLLLLTLSIKVIAGDTIYVKSDAGGAANGTSWTDAYTDLQSALDAAISDDSIWVAAGTYLPSKDKTGNSSPTDPRTKTFQLVEGISLFGGFDGTETDITTRNWFNNATILSGDIGVVDDISDNTYRVVKGITDGYLDGFTVRDGYANGGSGFDMGGGIQIGDPDGGTPPPTRLASMKVVNCMITGNKGNQGGGVATFYCGDSIVFRDCRFVDNIGGAGAGLGNWDTKAYVTRCVFVDNVTDDDVVVDHWGGGIYNWGSGSTAEVVSCTFVRNSSAQGGAIHDRGVHSTATNSIFLDNSPNDVYNLSSLTYSCLQQAPYPGSDGNIDDDPMLYDFDEGIFKLNAASPCIDAGDPTSPPDPDASTVDMGASHAIFSPSVDAGVESLGNPELSFVYGVYDIDVTLLNHGSDPLTSADIEWKVNGVTQIPYSWSGNIASIDTSDAFTIGSYDFTPGDHQIKIWSKLVPDEFHGNDTLEVQVTAIANMDAGVTALINPSEQFSYDPSSTDVKVTIKNFNIDSTINTVDIEWKVDGASQTAYSWTGTLSPGQTSDTLLLGTFSFARGEHTISVWTENPNGDPDDDHLNDTLNVTVYSRDLDIGVSHLYWPVDPDTIGSGQDVIVAITNYAENTTLTSATIEWEVDEVSQTQFNWTGSILPGEISDSITIGQFDLTSEATYDFKIWTEVPNGNTDDYHGNDTLTAEINVTYPLCGTFTIDAGGGGDFDSFGEAIDSLVNGGGICGNVEFVVASGTYNEQISIPEIYGASENRTITFRSASGDSTDVILTSSVATYTVTLNDADHIIFKNITIATTETYGAIYIGNGAAYNEFSNCEITGVAETSNLIHFAYDGNEYNQIIQNRLVDGKKGILNTGYEINNIEIIDNVIEGQTEGAIHLEYTSASTIQGNTITSSSEITGIYLYRYSGNIILDANKISLTAGGKGIWIYNCTNHSSTADLFSNNFIHVHQGTGIELYLHDSSEGINFYHNSIHISGSDGEAVGFYSTSSTLFNLFNNVILNEDAGQVIVISYQNNVTSDYNCFYTNGSSLINGNSLIYWQQNKNQDLNSFSIDPSFISDSDLHTVSPHLNGAGFPIAEVTFDVDGASRDASHPDIGADEYDPLTPLSGTYEIGTSATYFKTFNEAIDSLFAVGVGGPVTFEVEDGTYDEQVTIPWIANTSETDTVLFKSTSGDSSVVILTHSSTSETDNFTLKLDGADFITFKQITLKATGADYARIVDIGYGVNEIKFINNQFLGVGGKSELIYSNSLSDSNNLFHYNLFRDGVTGIYEINHGRNLELIGNEFYDQTSHAIYLKYIDAPVIRSNTIYSENQITAILLESTWKQLDLGSNQIFLPDGGKGIELISYTSTAGDTTMIYNNYVYLNGNPVNGISLSNYNFPSKIVFNTVNISGNNTSSACIHFSNSGYKIHKNNILVNKAHGTAISRSSDGTITSDHNNLFSNGANLTPSGSLEAWQRDADQDLNSISVDPYFIDDTTFQVTHTALKGAGIPINNITEDIEGDIRDTQHPDIGADEFVLCTSPISGTFTIGGDTPDFLTMQDAVEKMVTCGINGPVIFNIAKDTLSEQVSIQEISGASETNTITFQSESGDSTDVVITCTPMFQSLKHTIQLDGADYVIFKNVTIASGEEWGWPVHLKNKATNNQFLNNQFVYEKPITTVSEDKAFVYARASLDSSNTFISNYFDKGSIGISLRADDEYQNADGNISGTIIRNNVFANMLYAGIFLKHNSSLEVSGNQISLSSANSPLRGILVWLSDAGSQDPGIISNNFVYISSQNSINCYGIQLWAATNYRVYNNTVHMEGVAQSDNYALYFLGTISNTQIVNNILSNALGGAAMSSIDTTGLVSDYNLFYSSGSGLIGNYTSLSQWQNYSTRDMHSIVRQPDFVSATDLHTNDPWISNLGTPLTEVTTDIDGETRDSTNPDIGADEFEAATLFVGDYTIGATGDFASFTEAVDSIVQVGVFGDVTFKVEEGTYNEQFTLKEIPNVSDTMTVTFEPENAGDTVILEFKATGSDNYIVKFDSADFITFMNMTFRPLDSTYANVLEFSNGATNNVISNNIFHGMKNTGFLIYSSGSQDDNILIENNLFYDGNVGIYMLGESGTEMESGIRVIGNRLEESYSVSIYFKNQISPLAMNNTIIYEGSAKFDWVGIFLSSCGGQSDTLGLVVNNSIAFNSYTKSAGIALDATTYQRIYFNSVNVIGSATDSRTFNQQNGGSNISVMNNIFSNRAEGRVSYITDIGSLVSDYNNLYTDGSVFISTSTDNIDFQTWQSTHNKDLNSISVDPLFFSDTDLQASHPLLNGSGTPLAGINTDITGIARDTTHPDIGAYEFDQGTFDIGSDTTFCKNTLILIDAGSGYDSYLWNTGDTTQTISVISAIVDTIWYGVTVSYNSINYSDSMKITFKGPVIDLGDDDGFCEGESLELDAGTGSYTYLWSDGSTGQTLAVTVTGEYYVTVTDTSGCTGMDTVMITKSAGPVVDLGADQEFCEGDSVVLDAGTGNYSYFWSDQSTNQTLVVKTDGQVHVTVTDQYGCVDSDTINLTTRTGPAVDLGGDTGFCEGESVTLDAGSGYNTYLWSDQSTGQTLAVSAAGDYRITVTDAFGCKGSDTVTISTYTLPQVTIAVQDGILTTDFTNAVEYQWYLNTAMIPGANSETYEPDVSGNYQLQVVDLNGCSNFSNTIFVEEVSVGFDEEDFSLLVEIYPNPTTTGKFTIKFKSELSPSEIRILDITGNVIFHEKDLIIPYNYEKPINLQNISKGLYLIMMEYKAGWDVRKLVIE